VTHLLSHLERPAVVVAAGAVSYLGGLAAAGLSGEHREMLEMVSGAVVAVVAVVAWIDWRIERKIKGHNRLDRLRHAQIRRDVHHGFEQIALQLGVRAPAFEGEIDELSEPQG